MSIYKKSQKETKITIVESEALILNSNRNKVKNSKTRMFWSLNECLGAELIYPYKIFSFDLYLISTPKLLCSSLDISYFIEDDNVINKEQMTYANVTPCNRDLEYLHFVQLY